MWEICSRLDFRPEPETGMISAFIFFCIHCSTALPLLQARQELGLPWAAALQWGPLGLLHCQGQGLGVLAESNSASPLQGARLCSSAQQRSCPASSCPPSWWK